MTSDRPSRHLFFAIAALLFAGGAGMTIVRSTSMSSMGSMPMPGGWTMSMTWMRMPEQTWLGAFASFVGMWIMMMVPMMLPSFIPTLWCYRQAVARVSKARRGRLIMLAGSGYFVVWTAFGIGAFPIGVSLATIEMQQPALARAVPLLAGVVILLAGFVQLTSFKSRQLVSCRDAHVWRLQCPPMPNRAWRHGVRLGFQCAHCCANLMVILLVIGVMDLRVMAAVTAAITAERLLPSGERIARVTGTVIASTGLLLIARAACLA